MTRRPELPAAFADWPHAARDWFEERAAIREYDGRLPREEAERLAEADTRRKWRTDPPPDDEATDVR